MRKILLQGTAVALIAIAAPFVTSGIADAKVGVTSTTTGEPLGTPPAQPQRVLKVGIDVFANERIQTRDDDRAHLLFADGSALTIGPNSDLVIDRFVYDPARGSGDIAISATRGVFRLVGGKITKQGEATMKVGTATLGLRGGIAIIDASNPGMLDAFFMFGERLSISTPQGNRIATRPGSVIKTIFGQEPSSPALTPTGALSGPLAKLEAPSGLGVRGTSGVDAKVGESGINQVNSEKPTGEGLNAPSFTPPVIETNLRPVSVSGGYVRDTAFISYDPVTGDADRDPANNTGIATAGTYGGRLLATTTGGNQFNLPWTPGSTFLVDATNSTSSLGPVSGAGFVALNEEFYIYTLLDQTSGKKLNLFAGDPTLTASFQTTGVSARDMLILDVARPFLPESVSSLAVAANAAQSPLFIAHSPVLSAAQQAGSDQRATWFQASLNFEGTGSDQASMLAVNIGQFGSDANGALYASGTAQASLREDGNSSVTRFSSNISTAETGAGSAVYGGTGGYFVFVPDRRNDDLTPDSVTPQAGASEDLPTLTKQPYYYVTATAPTTAPAGLGASRTDRTLSGYTAGQIDLRDAYGNISTTQFASANVGDVSITTSATNNRAAASMVFTEVGNPYNSYDLKFGSLNGQNANSSAFIDDQRYALGSSPTGGSTNNGNPVLTNLAMVTHQGVSNDADLLPSGVSYCECEFMSWGYWMGDLKHETGPRAGETERVHVATWIAGTLPSQAEIPLSGTALYKGHAIGNVNNNGASYVAVGEFRQVWDFSARNGAFNIDNFDGGDYAGITSAPIGTPRDFSGSITGVAGTGVGRSGSVNGSFFASPTSPVAGQGGNFTINGTGYSAAGTYAGSRQP